MRAAVLPRVGGDELVLRDDVSTVALGSGEVRVRMRAAGVCHSDLSAMDGTLPASEPGVMGHEGAGEVVEIGSQVTDLERGDRVVIAYVPPCGNCRSCLWGQPQLCETYVLEGLTSPRFDVGGEAAFGFAGCGTFAEELVVPRSGAIRVDPDVPFEVAALIGCGVLTGVGAVFNTARMPQGANVAVIGCGGVGTAVLQAAKLAGAATVVAVDAAADKHERAKRFGATHTATPEGLSEVKDAVTGGAGFDYVYEVVGKASTIRAAYDATRRGGTVVVVGAGGAEEKVEFSAQELFITERRILPSFYGSSDVRRDVPLIVDLWRAGRLDLEGMISRRMQLADINEGVRALNVPNDLVRQVVTFES